MGLFDFIRRGRIKAEPVDPVSPQKSSVTAIPPGRVSRPTINSTYTDIKKGLTFVSSSFIAEYIPVIRKLHWINPDMGLAVNDMIQLTNTGHKIKFDPEIKPEAQKKMRQHIKDMQATWGDGLDGMHGLVNKMISQVWISGSLSNEWVPRKDLKGIRHIAMVNPETIVFRWNKKQLRFQPYQKQNYDTGMALGEKHVKLNQQTYKYFALNGDTELPYGIPPFLTALNAISTQGDMDKNISYVMKQLGLLGFFEALVEKPDLRTGESEIAYTARLNSLLASTKTNLMDGINEGIVVGYNEDHDFNFNSTTKNLGGVSEIYNQNEIQVANGLKLAPQFLGIGGSGAETGMNIIFTKMLSQLQNVQKIIAANLVWGYTLELKMAGFDFKSLEVEFLPSTITDELKFQQAMEYKVRNVANKYMLGVISMQQVADELGYDKPDATEPRGPLDNTGAEQERRQDQNDKSDKKTRDKGKPQPKKGESKNMQEFLSAFPEHLLNEFLDFYNKK